MEKLVFAKERSDRSFKILNATNGGPWYKRHADDQFRSNLEDYKAARIPYSRNHDSASCSTYGGPYSHDISNIFPDFDADPDDPASYDFACTDEELLKGLEAGTKTFFRLGQTIEHQIVKHHVFPPKDYEKWASVCEHIIRHYNEGWADGLRLNVKYWEIWNEPDLDDLQEYKRTWTGTREEFFDFFEIAAKHLKARFPQLMIGGPALAGNKEWAENFLSEMQKRNVPLDFFSWHVYSKDVGKLLDKTEFFRDLMDKYGYASAESILNEWNYVRGWEEDFVYSIEAIHGAKGAAFTAACICGAQDRPVDMLMYYDTRPSVFNGVFDFYTYRKLKGYYPLYWYGRFYDAAGQVPTVTRPENVWGICGEKADGKRIAMFSYFMEDDGADGIELSVDMGKPGRFEVFITDPDRDGESIGEFSEIKLALKPDSVAFIKEI